jgi:hypothetical protein
MREKHTQPEIKNGQILQKKKERERETGGFRGKNRYFAKARHPAKCQTEQNTQNDFSEDRVQFTRETRRTKQ